MLKQLMTLCEQKEFVSVYTNRSDTSRFIFGRILAVDDWHILIYALAPDGSFDGMLVKETQLIIRVEQNDKYSKKMKKLIFEAHHNETEFSGVLDQNLVRSLLLMAMERKKIVSVELVNSGSSDVIGFVDCIEEDICKIKQIDLYGQEDGCSYVFIDDITQVSMASQDEQIIERLHTKNTRKAGDG